MIKVEDPYFTYQKTDDLPGLDFTRRIHEPGSEPGFPEGVVSFFVDGNYWCIAALPYSYKDVSAYDVLKDLFPQWIDQIVITPDFETLEYYQYVFAERDKYQQETIDKYWDEIRDLRDQIKRYTSDPKELKQYPSTEERRSREYFHNEYIDMVISFAHEFVEHGNSATKAICAGCGRLSSDRVHMREYIDAPKHPSSKDLFYYRKT